MELSPVPLRYAGTLLALAACLVARPARAGWPTGPLYPVQVCASIGGNIGGTVGVSDGAGGALLAWEDPRNGNIDPYAQHVRADGSLDPAWPAAGCALSLDPAPQQGLSMVPDGAGGAFVAWMDMVGEWDIHAQHLLATGVVDPRWPADGQVVCVEPGFQSYPVEVEDGTGGVFIAWSDGRDAARGQVFTLHLLADGSVAPGWVAGGNALISSPTGSRSDPTIVADGAGGAVVAWNDFAGSPLSGVYSIRAQHLLAGGANDPAWPELGCALSPRCQYPESPRATLDGAGGAIVTWQDSRDAGMSIYSQHVLAGGATDPAWPDSGRVLCEESSSCESPAIASDGSGGALVSWMDNRNGPDPAPDGARLPSAPSARSTPSAGVPLRSPRTRAGQAAWYQLQSSTDWDVYAQHVTASGALDGAWPANGLPVCVAVRNQGFPSIVGDGAGNAFIAWQDFRNDVTTDFSESDVYVQRVRAGSGVDPAWPSGGMTPCTVAGYQFSPALVRDSGAGVLFAFGDDRSDAPGLYAQHVSPTGHLGDDLPVTVLSTLVDAGMAGGCVNVRWSVAAPRGSSETLYRNPGHQGWETVGSVFVGGSDMVTGTDCEVREGMAYGYRLGIHDGSGETLSSEVWVSIPAHAAGARLRVSNPVVGGSVNASFTLPDTRPVEVELFDLLGRKVASATSRATTSEQRVNLAAASTLEPGVYLLRVGLDRPVSLRVAVVR